MVSRRLDTDYGQRPECLLGQPVPVDVGVGVGVGGGAPVGLVGHGQFVVALRLGLVLNEHGRCERLLLQMALDMVHI